MKSVFIAGSRKFSGDVEKLARLLKSSGVRTATAGKTGSGKDTPESEKEALIRAFERIEASDMAYVFACDGYIGK